MIINLILNPKEFFSKVVEHPANLKIPFIIILVFGFSIFFQSSLPYIRFLNYIPDTGDRVVVLILFTMFFVFGILVSFLLWIVLSTIFWVVIKIIFKKTRDFKKTLEVVSYGFLPLIFGNVIYSIVWFICMLNIPHEILHIVQNHPQYILAASTLVVSKEVSYLLMIIIILSHLWSSLLWAEGLKQLFNVRFLKVLVITVALSLVWVSFYILI